MNWIELAKERPKLDNMGQSDIVLVAYYPGPDTELTIDLAFYDKAGVDSGWFQKETWKHMPAPRYWMPLPPVPHSQVMPSPAAGAP